MFTGVVGEGNSSTCTQILPLDIFASTTVTNLASSVGTVSYYNNGLNAAASGTIAPNASQTFTVPTWLTAAGGVTNIQVVGAGY